MKHQLTFNYFLLHIIFNLLSRGGKQCWTNRKPTTDLQDLFRYNIVNDVSYELLSLKENLSLAVVNTAAGDHTQTHTHT